MGREGCGGRMRRNLLFYPLFFGVFILPSLSLAKAVTCSTHSNGLYYIDNVKQCQYFCNNGCETVEVIGPGWEGDFGAFNCYGTIVVIQPSVNGQLSPNAVGYKPFTVQLTGWGSLWSAIEYGDLFTKIDRAFARKSCSNN